MRPLRECQGLFCTSKVRFNIRRDCLIFAPKVEELGKSYSFIQNNLSPIYSSGVLDLRVLVCDHRMLRGKSFYQNDR